MDIKNLIYTVIGLAWLTWLTLFLKTTFQGYSYFRYWAKNFSDFNKCNGCGKLLDNGSRCSFVIEIVQVPYDFEEKNRDIKEKVFRVVCTHCIHKVMRENENDT